MAAELPLSVRQQSQTFDEALHIFAGCRSPPVNRQPHPSAWGRRRECSLVFREVYYPLSDLMGLYALRGKRYTWGSVLGPGQFQ
jgi:hypothetical protein